MRQDVRDPERGPLLALRADMLMATGDAGAVPAYREALGGHRRPGRASAAAAAAGPGRHVRRRLRDRGRGARRDWSRTGPPTTPRCCSQRGILAYLTGDLAAAEAAADEARRRLGVADPGDWRMYDLISLQGLIAHLRGEWFSRLAVELRAGAERPDLARSMFDSHLCVAEFLLYGPTPYAEVLALAATLRESARTVRAYCGPSRSPPRCAARQPCSPATWRSPKRS